eukprot:CAMPEP_0119513326 /NCGR_PEP_ID=MMETSP1344-20130328/31468_1 /TAXON_ID=236787 /ORGANISM="Florenciella parvula, Strain CCMP2471" /LENGTH=32 /DNA_ID= /DNA_START= /DNA_END= /DNA_ORIENTATION=
MSASESCMGIGHYKPPKRNHTAVQIATGLYVR